MAKMSAESTPVADPVFARAPEAARRLGISKSLLWQWVKSRKDFPQPSRPSHGVTLFDVPAIAKHIKETSGQ